MSRLVRSLPILFLLLVAAHPGPHGAVPAGAHQGHPSLWRMGAHDGSSMHDFGRILGHREHAAGTRDLRDEREPLRLNSFQVGDNGARLGVGFVSGRHIGFRIKSPF